MTETEKKLIALCEEMYVNWTPELEGSIEPCEVREKLNTLRAEAEIMKNLTEEDL